MNDYTPAPIGGPMGDELASINRKLRRLTRELEDARRETRRTLYVALVIAGGHGVDIANIIPGY